MEFFPTLLIIGGPITWIITFFAVVSTLMILERLLHFHRAQINVPEFLRGVINVLKRGNAVEAVSICDDTPGPVAYVLRAAILRCEHGERVMKQAVEEASLLEIPRLERSLGALATIATLAPVLGLLGTVVGVIQLFQDMEAAGGAFVDVKILSQGIWQALISTAAGLCVGIPVHGFYNYYVRRVDNIILDMEKAASELIFFLSENPIMFDNSADSPRRK
ncbi:MAG: biopolymer transport protein ExbB [Rhodothermales bacterium]|jgi:biopolymer transport protein ExbB